MALDCYIITEGNGRYTVRRYKSGEFLEAVEMTIGFVSAINNHSFKNPFHAKRTKIVDQYLKDGKPKDTVYWIEQDQIKKTVLPKTRDNNPNPKIVVGNITNGYAQVWVNGKKTEIRVPPGMSHEEFNDLVRRVTGKDKDDSMDWLGYTGATSLDSYQTVPQTGTGVLSTPTVQSS